MTDSQPSSLRLDHQTVQDDTLTHQVRFYLVGHTPSVSCNCRATVGMHSKAGKLFYSPIGTSRNLDQSRKLYNDPKNHWAPFTDKDKAKW